MNPFRLVCLFPLAYIVAWFYYLVTWFIPLLNTPFGKLDWASMSLWSIIAPIIFIIGGLILLIVCLIVFIAIVVA